MIQMNYQFQYLTTKSVVTQLVNTSKAQIPPPSIFFIYIYIYIYIFEYLTPYIKCVTNQTFY